MHTINLESLKSSNIFCSVGVKVVYSFVLPDIILNARGIPSPSMNSSIWTMGLGLCSLDGPYCFKPSSCSISKK